MPKEQDSGPKEFRPQDVVTQANARSVLHDFMAAQGLSLTHFAGLGTSYGNMVSPEAYVSQLSREGHSPSVGQFRQGLANFLIEKHAESVRSGGQGIIPPSKIAGVAGVLGADRQYVQDRIAGTDQNAALHDARVRNSPTYALNHQFGEFSNNMADVNKSFEGGKKPSPQVKKALDELNSRFESYGHLLAEYNRKAGTGLSPDTQLTRALQEASQNMLTKYQALYEQSDKLTAAQRVAISGGLENVVALAETAKNLKMPKA